jgi:hypothetical protein
MFIPEIPNVGVAIRARPGLFGPDSIEKLRDVTLGGCIAQAWMLGRYPHYSIVCGPCLLAF